jgi:hypothetical protein
MWGPPARKYFFHQFPTLQFSMRMYYLHLPSR